MSLSKATLPFLFVTSVVALGARVRRQVDGSSFQADSSIDVAGIYSAVQAGVEGGNDVLASYAPSQGEPTSVNIMGDWLQTAGVYYFVADMDVDCDGVDWQCPGNTDGQDETSFGALDARQVPWYVIPEQFTDKHTDIQPNALGAIICGGNMFYAIFGDTNGDTPEVIGEGSLILAQTCFPNDGLDGGNGHPSTDVAYIIFPSAVPDGVGQNTIDIGALKTLGDKQVQQLQQALNVSGSGGGGGEAPSSTGTVSSAPTTTSTDGPDPTDDPGCSDDPDPSESNTGTPTPTTTDGPDPTPTPTSDPDDPCSDDPDPSETESPEPTPTGQSCQTDDDCSGSNVCCVFALSPSSSVCITTDQCSNGTCGSGGSQQGTCDA